MDFSPPEPYNLFPLLSHMEKVFALLFPPPSLCASSNQQITRKTLSHFLYRGYKSELRTPIQYQFSFELAHCSATLINLSPTLINLSPTLINLFPSHSVSCLENLFQPVPRPWQLSRAYVLYKWVWFVFFMLQHCIEYSRTVSLFQAQDVQKQT